MCPYTSGDKNCYYFLNILLAKASPELNLQWKKMRGIQKKSPISKPNGKKVSSKHWKTAFKATISKGDKISDLEKATIEKLMEITKTPLEFLKDSKGADCIKFRSIVSKEKFLTKCSSIYKDLNEMMNDYFPQEKEMPSQETPVIEQETAKQATPMGIYTEAPTMPTEDQMVQDEMVTGVYNFNQDSYMKNTAVEVDYHQKYVELSMKYEKLLQMHEELVNSNESRERRQSYGLIDIDEIDDESMKESFTTFY